MAEQENKETIVFLPWVVEPQTQAVILQQPNETHLRLDATTDKTAISSFALSVVIALILGGLATWLAYWYGRKSFDLTKQSFDAVIAQIKSSEQIALNLNQKLFEQQKELQKLQETYDKQKIKEKQLRELASMFLIKIKKFSYDGAAFLYKYGHIRSRLETSFEITKEFIILQKQCMEIEEIYINIDLHLDIQEEIHHKLSELIILCYEYLNLCLEDERSNSVQENVKLYKPIQQVIISKILDMQSSFKEYFN